jgi:DNA polymerase III subunit delta
MKLKTADTQKALRQLPPGIRAVLVFGPDEALVRDRSKRIGRQIVADLKDPFNVSELSGADLNSEPSRLLDEASALSLMGGARLVRVSGASDSVLEALMAALEHPAAQSLMILTAGELTPKSKLRSFAEKRADVLAMACYPEDARSLIAMLSEEAGAQGYRLASDAAQLLLSASGGERDIARQELTKVLTYINRPGAEVTAAEAQDIVAHFGGADFEDLVAAVCGGKAEAADAQVSRLMSEGTNGIAMLRAVARRLWMLIAAQAAMANGQSAREVADKLFGAMAWKQAPAFLSQLDRWSAARCDAGLARLSQAERDSKITGAAADLIAARALLALSAR